MKISNAIENWKIKNTHDPIAPHIRSSTNTFDSLSDLGLALLLSVETRFMILAHDLYDNSTQNLQQLIKQKYLSEIKCTHIKTAARIQASEIQRLIQAWNTRLGFRIVPTVLPTTHLLDTLLQSLCIQALCLVYFGEKYEEFVPEFVHQLQELKSKTPELKASIPQEIWQYAASSQLFKIAARSYPLFSC